MRKRSLIKPKGTLHISNDLSRMEKLTWNILLASCKDELGKRGDFRIKALDLLNHLGLGDSNYSYLKKILKSLNGTQVEWNILGADKKIEWGITTLLSSAKLKQGICFFEFSKELRSKIVESNLYARIWFHIEKKLMGKHSLTIYEFLLAYYNCKKGVGDTPKLLLLDFKKAIGKEGQYNEFKNLKRFVVVPAIKDINKNSDINATFETFKNGRKVEYIKFHIEANERGESIKKSLPGAYKENQSEIKANVELWVNDIIDLTGHEQSKKFYYKVSWKFILAKKEELIYRAISETKADYNSGNIKKNKAAIFNAIIQRLARENNIDLELKKQKILVT